MQKKVSAQKTVKNQKKCWDFKNQKKQTKGETNEGK